MPSTAGSAIGRRRMVAPEIAVVAALPKTGSPRRSSRSSVCSTSNTANSQSPRRNDAAPVPGGTATARARGWPGGASTRTGMDRWSGRTTSGTLAVCRLGCAGAGSPTPVGGLEGVGCTVAGRPATLVDGPVVGGALAPAVAGARVAPCAGAPGAAGGVAPAWTGPPPCWAWRAGSAGGVGVGGAGSGRDTTRGGGAGAGARAAACGAGAGGGGVAAAVCGPGACAGGAAGRGAGSAWVVPPGCRGSRTSRTMRLSIRKWRTSAPWARRTSTVPPVPEIAETLRGGARSDCT